MRRQSRPIALTFVLLLMLGTTAIPGSPVEARATAGRYIVRFTDTAVTSTRQRTQSHVRLGSLDSGWRVDAGRVTQRIRSVRSMGIKPRHVFRNGIGGFSATLTAAQVTRLREDPNVAGVDIDAPVSVEDRVEGSVVSVAKVSPQTIPTGVRRIGATQQPLAHIGSGTDTNVDIAVIDTGIAAHPDLRIAGGVNCTGVGGGSYNDVYGHGTHVAGIIGARDNGFGVVGVVPGARLWAIKSIGDNGRGATSDILCGLDWMIGEQQSADGPRFTAANMSIAGPLVYPNRPCGIGTGDAYHQLICAALDSGIVIAAAAANDHRVVNLRPAIYDEPITVGAIADFDGKPGGKGKQKSICPWYSVDTDDTFANFSDWGPAVDILAPGKCILSTFTRGRYAWMSGTSMATPLVAGAIALYRMRYPDAKPQQVKQALVSAGTLDWRTSTSPDGRRYRLLQVWRFTPPPVFSVSAGTGRLGGAGTSHGIKVSVSRKYGHYRPISVRVQSDPVGVGSVTLRLGTGVDIGTLRLLGSAALVTGTYQVTVIATDGETRATTSVPITVDADPPEGSITGPAPRTTTVQTGRTVRLTASATDAGSGVASRTVRRRAATPTGLMSCAGATYRFEGPGTTPKGTTPFTVSGPKDGVCYQWALTSTDRVGNTSVVYTGAVWIDGSAPLDATASAQGAAAVRGSTVWYRGGAKGTFTLTLTGKDPQSGITDLRASRIGGSGWEADPATSISIDPGNRSASITRTYRFGAGSTASSLTVTSVDGVGKSRTTTLQTRPDTVVPDLSIASPVKQTWLGSDQAVVRYAASDAGAGIGKVSAQRERAALPSRAAGCTAVTWEHDGPAATVTGGSFTSGSLERDTCYRWVVTATDRVGHARSRTTAPVAIDPTRPEVGEVRLTIARGTVGTKGSIPMLASWTLRAAPVGTTSYQVARSGDAGASWQAITHAKGTAKAQALTIGSGVATTVSVRARSTTGAVSPWATSVLLTPRLVQEDAPGVTTSSGWSRATVAAASGGHRLESTKRGASVTFRFTGHRVGLVAARGSRLGHAIVRIDGSTVATVSLRASSTQDRRIVWTRSLGTGAHTITVVVKDGRVAVDGFVVTKSGKGATR